MFEMEYDKDGQPKQNKELENVQEEVQETPAFSAPVEEEIQQEENVEVEDVLTAPTDAPGAPQEPQKETPAAKSFRELREKLERSEREKDELLRFVISSQPKVEQPVQQEEDLNLDLNPDDLAEGKHLSKVYKKIEKLEQQLAQSKYQTTEMQIEAKLKAEFPDFDNIVNSYNIELLKAEEPELAESILTSQDLYKKAKAVYKSIKKMGIGKVETPIRNLEKEQLNKNLQKPRSVNSINPQKGESPLHIANAFANGLTDDVKAQLYKEMNDAIKKS